MEHTGADFTLLQHVHRVEGPDSFGRVAADADLLSISTASRSIASTVYGLGATTGHGLMVAGEWMVDRVDVLAKLVRLQSLLSRNKLDKWTLEDTMYLLDHQRSGSLSFRFS